jgi:hypothetical protein
MQMLTCGGGDAEGLFHQPIHLVPVAIGLSVILILVTSAAGFWGCVVVDSSRGWESGTPLSLHLSIRQETSRHSAGTP